MKLFEKLKAKTRAIKHIHRKAIEEAENKIWLDSYYKAISPNRIEVFDTNLIIDQRTYVRCLIIGLPKKNGEGYPRDMTSKAIERIQELSFDSCKIMISHSLIQIPNEEARENMQQTSFTINVNQAHAQSVNPGGTPDLALMCQGEDVVSNYRQMYFNSHRSFHSSFIIVISGPEKEVFTAESYIISILKSELIEVHIPTGRQFEMFEAALPFPISDSKSWVEVRSDTAAVLCTSTNLNSKTDEKGLYFGKDLKTNNEIMIDLDTLPAKHLAFLGATGSGKTFSMLLLLMRMHDMCNSRIVYTTPKADSGTNYRAVAEYYGPDSCIVDIGPGRSNVNPLQFMHSGQGINSFEAEKIYDYHKTLFIKACMVKFGASFSANMESYLDESLNMVYEQSGIYRDKPDSWRSPFPVMRNIYSIWDKDSGNKELGTKAQTAEALKNKFYQVTEKGSLRYVNQPTTDLDLSKGFVVIDLSNVPDTFQDFMNVMVTGMIAGAHGDERETIIAVDEAAVYLRNPELSLSLIKTLTMGRSRKRYLWVASQQPGDFAKNNVKEEFKTNMFINIILGANLKNAIEYASDYFELSEGEKEVLSNADVGEGLLIVKDERIPIRFEPTDLEKSVIKGTYGKQNTLIASEFNVFSELQWIVDEQGVIFSDWGIGDSSILKSRGYEKHMVTKLTEAGKTACFIPLGKVNDGHIYPEPARLQTVDHFTTVLQLAALLVQGEYEEIHIIHDEGVDVEAKKNGETYGYDYEKYNNKNLDKIVKKLEAALEKYNNYKIICSATDYKIFSKVIKEEYLLKRGEAVLNYVINPLNSSIQELKDE